MNLSPKERFQSLSPREREVLALVCQYKKYSEIAKILFVSDATVKAHMRKVYEKFDLMHLDRDERIMQIRTVYCPMFLEKSTEKIEFEISEPQIIEPEPEPITPEVNEILDKDEVALVAFAREKTTNRKGKGKMVKTNKKKGGGVKFILVLFAIALLAFAGWQAWQWISATPAIKSMDAYEVGEWHKQDDRWIRVSEYDLPGRGRVRIVVQVWNKSSNTLTLSWIPMGNFELIDNAGNHYDFSRSDLKNDRFEVSVDPGDIVDIKRYGVGLTVEMNNEAMYNENVNELYFTISGFSKFDTTTWRLNVNK